MAHHEPWYGESAEPHVKKLMERADETGNKRLNPICRKYLDGCPYFFKHIAVGDPAHEILQFIARENVDPVVMASHGEGGHSRFGSVAEKVLKHSTVPVTVIPVKAG